MSKNKVSSLLAWAQEQGKVTGVVTTDRFENVFFLAPREVQKMILDIDLPFDFVF